MHAQRSVLPSGPSAVRRAPVGRARRAPRRVAAIAAAALLGAVVQATASTQADGDGAGPRQIVRETVDRLFSAMEREQPAIRHDPARAEALVERIVSPSVDFDLVSHWVLGRHWKQATPAQKERFKEEFRQLVFRSYATAVVDYSGKHVSFLSTRTSDDGKQAMVRTRIPGEGGPPLNVDYRLRRDGGRWKLFDVVVDGASLVATYRSTFANEIESGGMDRLLQRLSARNPARSPQKRGS